MFTHLDFHPNNDIIPFKHISHSHYLYPVIKYNHWKCDICKDNYNIRTISFYCTQCDFDVCGKCGNHLTAYDITQNNEINLKPGSNNSNQIHHHPLEKVFRSKTFHCDGGCDSIFAKGEYSYYCKICDFDCCVGCYNKTKENEIKNPIFFIMNSNNKMANNFNTRLFNEVICSNINTNVSISPLSVHMVLSLAANGAVGETLNEFLNVLKEKNLYDINNVNMSVLSTTMNSQALKIANVVMSICNITNSFMGVVNDYRALVTVLNNVQQVNYWCAQQTNGRINHIIDSIDPRTKIILLNAVYFKCSWLNSFDKMLTQNDNFYSRNGIQSIKMMQITASFPYFENNSYQIVKLPYKENGFSAIVILPKNDIDNVNYTEIEELVNSSLFPTKIHLRLPKFSFSFRAELNDPLRNMGLRKAFENRNEFTNITNQYPLYISKVIHETFIEVDEEGTEAAAVTAAILINKGFNAEKIVEMYVNRPFLFFIRKEEVGQENKWLFMTKVNYI